MFDWIRFLDDCGVDYVVGPKGQVRAGHIGINCPRCANDSGFHFNIDAQRGLIRGCWRSKDHWMPPGQLVAELSGRPLSTAFQLLRGDERAQPPDSTKDLLERLEALDKPQQRGLELEPVELPRAFQAFHRHPTRAELPFRKYMRKRGFARLDELSEIYSLRWCARGRWGPRIVFPLWDASGCVVGWTARSIVDGAQSKYKSWPDGEGIGSLIWALPGDEGELLVLVEGPFDGLNLDWFAADRPIGVAAILGLSFGPAKLSTIVAHARGFRRTIILLDDETEAEGLALQESLAVIGAELSHCPRGAKDPGAMSKEQVTDFLDSQLAVGRWNSV